MRKTLIITSVIVIAVAGIASYGLSHDSGDSTNHEGNPATGRHNAVDVMFAQGMIPHHEGAIAMADLAPSRSTNAAVLALAQRIKAAQGPEITRMKGWLGAWNEPTTMPGMDHDMAGMDHGSTGMMSAEDMTALANATGEAFDRAFLTQMITHHQGAIDMATTEMESGAYGPAIELANGIVKSQQAEIGTMQQLLRQP